MLPVRNESKGKPTKEQESWDGVGRADETAAAAAGRTRNVFAASTLDEIGLIHLDSLTALIDRGAPICVLDCVRTVEKTVWG